MNIQPNYGLDGLGTGDENYSVPPLNYNSTNNTTTTTTTNTNTNTTTDTTGDDPSVPRRLSRQLSNQLVRQMSRRHSVTNLSNFVPTPFANAVPFLNRGTGDNVGGGVQETYFCHICFMNNARKDGFKLSNCNHMFCTECIKGYWSSRIENGNVYLKCFHPINDNSGEHCGKVISELDVAQVVDSEVMNKYRRFKENLENPNARQCPKCQHTQTGDPNNPIMTCEQCNTQYCLYHSTAHPIEERCEAYESRTLKEDRLNREVTKDAKGCPRCKYLIEKNGGCNHMKCIKCGCSFCWLCLQEIEDIPIPSHFKDGNSACAGKQFEGMEEMGPPPPRWLVVIMVFFGCIFAIPALVIAAPLACLCFPCVWCCETLFIGSSRGRDCTFVNLLGGCWVGWLLLFLFVVVLIPLTVIISILKNIFGLCGIQVCSSLDQYNQQVQRQQEQQQQRQAQLQQQRVVANDILLQDPLTAQEESDMRRALQESVEEVRRQNQNGAPVTFYGSTGTGQQVVLDIEAR